MAKEAYYFSHDANARTDPKILQMRSVYKSEGYGWYWMLIEKMREEADYTLSIQGKYVWNAFALEMDATAERIKAFVEDCICEFMLFESDGNKIWSNSLLERMKIKDIKSEKARQSAEARWNKAKGSKENQGLERSESDGNANASKNDAIKESKRKENKINNIVKIALDYTDNETLQETIKDFSEMRTKIKKPLTDKALTLILDKLSKLSNDDETKIAILNQSIEHSWQSIFELKETPEAAKPKPTTWGDVSS